jgi:hypothetical protein
LSEDVEWESAQMDYFPLSGGQETPGPKNIPSHISGFM